MEQIMVPKAPTSARLKSGFMLTDLDLINIQARALFTHDSASRLLSVNEPDGANVPAPRLFLGRTRAGNIWRFRAGLPEELCDELNALCADEPPLDDDFKTRPRQLEKIIRLLEADAPLEEISSGPAYWFTEYRVSSKPLVTVTGNKANILRGGFEKLVEELPNWQPFVALVEDGQAVSVCRSVRLTSEAHEAGVETLPDFRGRGSAQEVTSEWARQVQTLGVIPLYSTSWENIASQAVARKLGLKCYGTDFHIT
jgi:RimJ/RimL family protein N-acetyltransferase